MYKEQTNLHFSPTLLTKFTLPILFLGLLAFFFISTPEASAAAQFVQATSAKSGFSATVTATFNSNVTSGNVIAVAAGSGSAGTAITSLTATCVIGDLTLVDNETTTIPLGLAYGLISSSGPCSVTVNFASSHGNNLIMSHEISGVTTTLDGHNTKLNGCCPTSATSNAIVTTTPGDYIFGAVYVSSIVTPTSSAGFTQRVSATTYATEDQIQSSAGSISASFGFTGNTSSRIGIMAFSPTGGVSPPPPPYSTPPPPPYPTPPESGNYTVKADGSGNFTTIQACANVAVAGETCEVYAGTYAGWAQPVSGSSGNPITFKAHAGGIVTITSGITITSRSYITVGGTASNEGFRIITTSGAGIGGNKDSDNAIIQNNYVYAQGGRCIQFDPGATAGTEAGWVDDVIIRFNTVYHCGWGGGGVGAEGIYALGRRVLIEGNTITDMGQDGIITGGVNGVVRNNTIDRMNCNWTACDINHHLDGIQVSGNTWNYSLLEGNVMRGCIDPTGNCHFFFVRNQSGTLGSAAADNIIARFNYAYDLEEGGFQFGGANDTVPNARAYNNTMASESDNATTGLCVGFTNAAGSKALNNLCYNTAAAGWSPIYLDNGAAGPSNYTLAFHTGYSGIWNAPYLNEVTHSVLKNKDPLFANYPTDGTLQSTSPARDAGGSLTTVNVGDGGAGTTLLVNDARFFQPGWAGVQPDWIAVGTTNNVVQISSINYANNTITLTSSISRIPGQSVWLYKNSSGTQVLHGSAPDIGAYEYCSSNCVAPPSQSSSSGSSGSSGGGGGGGGGGGSIPTELTKQSLIIQIMIQLITLLTQMIALIKAGAANALSALQGLWR